MFYAYINLPYSTQQTIAFVDPSALPDNPGWPLRNLLAYLRAVHPNTTSTVRILSWRDSEIPSGTGSWKSRFGVLSAAASAGGVNEKPSALGWEKNVQGKLGPRMADLAPMMDPTR
jgi:ubiquitin-like modifier-activating enzyme ATG7